MAQKKEQLDNEEQFPEANAQMDATVNAAMQQQAKIALYNLIKQCETLGVDLKEMFPSPPSATTEVLAPGVVNYVPSQPQQQQQMQPVAAPRRPGAPVYPGTVNSPWYEWSKEDLDPNDTVEFVPIPIPGFVWPRPDEFGRAKIKVDVNNLVCWLTVGEVNKVNRMFYNVYMDALKSWQELEAFKKRGPEWAPWGGLTGPNGQPSWTFEPFAVTHGLSLDGRPLTAGVPTIDQELSELGKADLLVE